MTTIPESLKTELQKIDDKFLYEARKKLKEESKKNSKILEQHNKDSFVLNKDLLILAGTVFGSSIALAAGRSVNNLFVFGELFLFLSIISGLILLLAHLKAKEWDYAFSTKNSLESYLIMNKNKIEKFELDATENLILDYKKIINSNQSGILYSTLKIISLEKWPVIFNVTFLIGIFLIFSSVIPQTIIDSILMFIKNCWNTLLLNLNFVWNKMF